MARTPIVGFRFSVALVRRLDTYAANLSEQTGVPVSRAAAAAKLLSAALATEESAPKREKRGRRD
jgi:hypothetical protein